MTQCIDCSNTRLEILSRASFICDKMNNILYVNPMCKELVRSGERNIGSACSSEISDSEFEKFEIRLYGHEFVLYIEKKNNLLISDMFPLARNATVNTALNTFGSRLIVPLFGGKVEFENEACDTVLSALNMPFGLYSPMNLEYLSLETVSKQVLEKLKKRCGVKGYRIFEESSSYNTLVCRANVFDITVTITLLARAMLELSKDKCVYFKIENISRDCIISARIGEKYAKRQRVDADKVFSKKSKADKVMLSVIDFCNLFLGNVKCDRGENFLEISLVIPLYKLEPVRFKDDHPEKYSDMFNFAELLFEM